MRTHILPLVAMLVVALLLAGCGKSAEMKQMESDLYASVTKAHDEGMALMNKANDMSAKVDEAIANFQKLASDHPKETAGHSMDDLSTAKQKLSAAVASMKEWMAGFKPYDETMNHEEVMIQLNGAKEGVTKVKTSLEEALTAATTAIDSHKTFADEIAARFAKPAKKMVKK
ncbi:MAG: hypothetical protein AB1428_07710 [Bacteroidota bacterium]